MQSALLVEGEYDWLNDKIGQVKTELTAFAVQDAKRSAFHCKMQFTQYGEVASKYCFNMEKRNFVSKSIYMVRKGNGEWTKDYSEIFNE